MFTLHTDVDDSRQSSSNPICGFAEVVALTAKKGSDVSPMVNKSFDCKPITFSKVGQNK